jgi:hypothetical protein
VVKRFVLLSLYLFDLTSPTSCLRGEREREIEGERERERERERNCSSLVMAYLF